MSEEIKWTTAKIGVTEFIDVEAVKYLNREKDQFSAKCASLEKENQALMIQSSARMNKVLELELKLAEANEKYGAYYQAVQSVNAKWLEHGCVKNTFSCDICRIYELMHATLDKQLTKSPELQSSGKGANE
jgi:hypothetical protein